MDRVHRYKGYPAVNVKLYDYVPTDAVMKRFGCSEQVAEQALLYQLEGEIARFWEFAIEQARQTFGPSPVVFSEGRSGGWLVVSGLPDLEEWTAEDLLAWQTFEALVIGAIGLDPAQVLEEIESNRWAEEGAEEYNYIHGEHGDVCMVEVNQARNLAIQEVNERFGI